MHHPRRIEEAVYSTLDYTFALPKYFNSNNSKTHENNNILLSKKIQLWIMPRYRNTAIDGPTASTKKPSSYNPVIIIQIAKIIQIMILVC